MMANRAANGFRSLCARMTEQRNCGRSRVGLATSLRTPSRPKASRSHCAIISHGFEGFRGSKLERRCESRCGGSVRRCAYERKAQQGARANAGTCHGSCWRTPRASSRRGSSLTLGEEQHFSICRSNYDPTANAVIGICLLIPAKLTSALSSALIVLSARPRSSDLFARIVAVSWCVGRFVQPRSSRRTRHPRHEFSDQSRAFQLFESQV